jgi:hypothetical protein
VCVCVCVCVCVWPVQDTDDHCHSMLSEWCKKQ